MTNPQTEARAIVRWTRDAAGWVEWPDGEWVRYSDHTAALEAQAAELAAATRRAERAEAQLAEARKALEPFAEVAAAISDKRGVPESHISDETWVSLRLRECRAARAALTTEPAAPEGRQDDEPRAYIVHAPEDDHYGTRPDRLQFHPLTQHELDNGYRQTPLYVTPHALNEGKVDGG